MLRTILTTLPLLVVAQSAWAVCPDRANLQGDLTCSSSYAGVVTAADDSYLGGECEDEACYSCGDPYANENQVAAEAIYSFECQLSGTVTMLITDLTCDLDIYVLDESCDPYTGCLHGSTSSYAEDDSVEFECVAGEVYHVVVEAYGTEHLDVASGPCTDDGTATGTVYDPTYTLSFDVSSSTGCAEDCDDGADNDLDGDADCDDRDCWAEDFCCDTDGDGAVAEDCEGADCDDTDATVYPGADEDGGTGTNNGDGVDNDCDDVVDEGTNDFDDDGDGYTENQGDCDDDDVHVNPDALDEPDNGVDEDCDGQDATTTQDSDPPDTTDDTESEADLEDPEGDTAEGKDDPGMCGCSAARAGLLGAGLGWLLVGAAVVRRHSGGAGRVGR